MFISPKKATSETDLSDARKKLSFLLEEEFTLRLSGNTELPNALARVDYIDDDGETVPVSTGSTGKVGHIVGILILLIVLVPTLYYGVRWAYEKHQTMRYRTLAPFGRATEDQEAIISHEQTEQVAD